jgi:hypothetical protein
MPHRHPTRIDIYQRFSAKGHPEQWLYDVMKEALARYQAANTAYSLELLELSLLMQSYMNISGHFRGEESWAVKGLCVNMALAMGLHREPSLWKMPADIAERRRVAWWHVVNADRYILSIAHVELVLMSPQLAIPLAWPPNHYCVAPL